MFIVLHFATFGMGFFALFFATVFFLMLINREAKNRRKRDEH